MTSRLLDPTPCCIIAEAGVNHNGDMGIALDLVDAAAAAGVDYVKFQTFKADRLASGLAPKAGYQERTTGQGESQLDMLRRLEMSDDMHQAVMTRCVEKGVRFLSTAGETESLRYLAEGLRLDTIKLGSGELTNAPLLLAAARTPARLMLSTGMGTLAEVEEALGVLAFGMMNAAAPTTRRDFADALLDPAAWQALQRRVMLLHCTTEYPAAIDDTNLRAMDTMAAAFGLPVGYSDHTEGNAMSIAAVARGAAIIEKHFTLDRGMEGPDHAASIEPDELVALVRDIRAVERGLGSGIKQPGAVEIQNRTVVRRSVLTTRPVAAGTWLTADDLTVKRPGNGISAMDLWDCIGRPAARDLEAEVLLGKDDLR